MSEKIKILYIDDEQANLNAFYRIYHKEYEIQITTSAQVGLALIKHTNFHVLLVDQRMPNITGVEFFSKLPKEIYSIKILITAYTNSNDLIDAINKGQIYKYVPKPYKKELLIKILAEAYKVYCYRKNQREDFYKYKEIFTHSSDPIFLIGKSGEILDVNSSFLKLLSTPRNKILNQLYTDIFKKNILTPRLIARLRSGENLENIALNFETHDNRSIECLISIKHVHINLSKTIGYHVAVRNISDYKALNRSLFRNIIAKQAKEKEQISYTLHENTAQNLSAIKLYMNILYASNKPQESPESEEMIASSTQALDLTIKELRNMCFKLMPRSLLLDVKGTLYRLCEQIKQDHLINCHLMVNGDLSILNKDLIVILFKKVQETLNYIKKTKDIKLTIKVTDQHLLLEIEGKRITLSPLEINHLFTEMDSYQGKLAINNLKKKRIRYGMSFPLEMSFN